ncbi:MAG: response regulator [Anaerolineae bacterium]|nr:response regulator [Anaerolineae bacterium]
MSYVMIVDDDVNMAQAIADMVSLLDRETYVAHGPRQAILHLREAMPDLILLDLNMGGVDGLEVCRYIKRDPAYGDTPVVFVTAEDDPGLMEKARAAGAQDYLVKPVDFDRLEAVIARLAK